MVTERWRPPVQPIATTRCDLPSATYWGSRYSSSGSVLSKNSASRPSRATYFTTAGSKPVSAPQVGLPVRVGQEADVEHDVGVAGRAVLVAERAEGDREPARLAGREHLGGDLAAQRGGAQPRRVDDRVRALADRAEQLLLAVHAVGDVAVAGQRVAPAGLLVAGEQRLLVGLEEQHADGDVARVQLVEHRGELLEVLAAAQVGDDAGALHLGALVQEQPGERADHRRGQVVDGEVARVLEDVHGRRLAGAREPETTTRSVRLCATVIALSC